MNTRQTKFLFEINEQALSRGFMNSQVTITNRFFRMPYHKSWLDENAINERYINKPWYEVLNAETMEKKFVPEYDLEELLEEEDEEEECFYCCVCGYTYQTMIEDGSKIFCENCFGNDEEEEEEEDDEDEEEEEKDDEDEDEVVEDRPFEDVIVEMCYLYDHNYEIANFNKLSELKKQYYLSFWETIFNEKRYNGNGMHTIIDKYIRYKLKDLEGFSKHKLYNEKFYELQKFYRSTLTPMD
jgi:hypothetical protein